MAKPKKPEPEPAKAKYQPTAREQLALDKFNARRAAEAAPRMKVVNDGKAPEISLDHPGKAVGYVLLMEALGTTDYDFLDGLLRQLANQDSHDNQLDEGKLNFLLSIVKGVKPRDQLEAMLAAQMAVVHMASMTFARRLSHVDNIQQQDSAERAFNKLTRTYTTQLEALKRYRTGGEQKVTVQHVSVSEGGQAIVGNVTQNASETLPKAPAKPAPALTDARKPAMTIIDQSKRAPVSVRRKQKDDGQSST